MSATPPPTETKVPSAKEILIEDIDLDDMKERMMELMEEYERVVKDELFCNSVCFQLRCQLKEKRKWGYPVDAEKYERAIMIQTKRLEECRIRREAIEVLAARINEVRRRL